MASILFCPFGKDREGAHKFIRFVFRHFQWPDPLNPPPYQNRCMLVHLDMLSKRRDSAATLFVANRIQGLVDARNLLGLVSFRMSIKTGRIPVLPEIPFHRTNYRTQEPVSWLCKIFNRYQDRFDLNSS